MIIKKPNYLLLIAFCLLPTTYCFSQENITPKPTKFIPLNGQFEVYTNTKIFVQKEQPELREMAETFVNQLNSAGNFKLSVQEMKAGDNPQNAIVISLKKIFDKNINDESYHLKVVRNSVQIMAMKPKGIWQGLEVFRQLLPKQITNTNNPENLKWIVPACEIIDNGVISAKIIGTKNTGIHLNLQPLLLNQNSVIRFTTNGETPTSKSLIYEKPINLPSDFNEIQAAIFSKEGQQLGNILSKNYFVNKSTGKKYTVKNQSMIAYNGGSENGLTNGIKGEQRKSETWVGFNNDLDLVLDLGEITEITRVSMSFLRNNKRWIFLPTNVEVSISSNGKTYESVQKVELDATMNDEIIMQAVGVGTGQVKTRFIKVVAKNYGKLPEAHSAKGNNAWLFVDEISVE
jgi:Glycosyl hydrolase family 20, domain 2/Fn3 associated/F5/8 type C domain